MSIEGDQFNRRLDNFLSDFSEDEQERILRYALDHIVPKLRGRTAIQQAESEPVGAREALERIASWSEHPAMLGVDYGSNGVRDYYRKIARDALTHPAPGVPEDVARDAKRYRWLRSLEHCNEAWCFIGSGNANSNLDAAIDAAMLAASPAQKG